MNSSRHESLHSDGWGTAEETLRLIAGLPAPDGLVDRVQSGLRKAPNRGSLLRWPLAMMPAGGWAQTAAYRGAAAAAIVFVVAGGGWRIYSHAPVAPSARVIVMPGRMGGGFSSAGAIHTPDTLTGPVLTHAVTRTAEVESAKPAHGASPLAPRGTRHARHSKTAAAAMPVQ